MLPPSSLSLTALAAAFGATSVAAQAAFDWTSITPSKELEWHDCMSAFKCARILVPYNWANESDTRTMALALQKLPAVVAEDDPAFGGSIFVNPGGPGHGGTSLVQTSGQYLQQSLDKAGVSHYEIVSWDPRGMANSEPRLECLDRPWGVDTYLYESAGNWALDTGRSSIAYSRGIYEGIALKCKQKEAKGLDIFRYVSTTDVVDDLKHMAELVDEPRKDKKRFSGRLRYYGFSYGTFLGQLFASRHPGSVSRVATDGNIDVDDYLAAPGKFSSGLDVDNIAEHFYELCYKAKSTCNLYSSEDTSAADLQHRVETFIKSLDDRPIGWVLSTGERMVITGHDFRSNFAIMAYSPIVNFPVFARVVAAAMKGDFTLIATVNVQLGGYPDLESQCGAEVPLDGNYLDSLGAVECTDADEITDKDLDFWADYVEKMGKVSYYYGFALAAIRFTCSSWPFRAVNRFTGPFKTPEADPNLVEGKPAAPLLFVNTRLDPVTPLASARNMQKDHAGAGLLILEAAGHGALTVAPSECRDKALREYFHKGTVPDGEKVCEAECGPFDAGCAPTKAPNTTAAARRSELFEKRSGNLIKHPLGFY